MTVWFALLRGAAYASVFVGFLLIFLPARMLEWSGLTAPRTLGPAQFLGAVVVVLGGALALWCIVTFSIAGRGTPAPFDPPRRLVVAGPYRYVRNPMYWGAVLALSGAALFYRSVALAGYDALFFVAMNLFVFGHEEPALRRSFGPEYEAYCRSVGRWWPRPGGGSPNG
jgi:protein-S-isoprenylcysteine O-methyltransferase Ste14